MSDINIKQIEIAARQFANKMQSKTDMRYEWNSCYEGYKTGAIEALKPKQANGNNRKHEKALPINSVVFSEPNKCEHKFDFNGQSGTRCIKCGFNQRAEVCECSQGKGIEYDFDYGAYCVNCGKVISQT